MECAYIGVSGINGSRTIPPEKNANNIA